MEPEISREQIRSVAAIRRVSFSLDCTDGCSEKRRRKNCSGRDFGYLSMRVGPFSDSENEARVRNK
jgi:hypothetical protein